MTTLPPYSGDIPQCPKCSHCGARTEWQPAEHRLCGAPAVFIGIAWADAWADRVKYRQDNHYGEKRTSDRPDE
ncbi:hypothetical protein [Streptomyces boncukensis]|uniref:Uncharacterized protein n=1 Tax=Streptomyces boncukensis TaxID=2711219 RepID=A0A6G4X4P9_9ACTN|nr:hypothetical protein [Streptomyces boncukensis]NGO71827.1 hypothetical protein [Streptomyces boncukensis]